MLDEFCQTEDFMSQSDGLACHTHYFPTQQWKACHAGQFPPTSKILQVLFLPRRTIYTKWTERRTRSLPPIPRLPLALDKQCTLSTYLQGVLKDRLNSVIRNDDLLVLNHKTASSGQMGDPDCNSAVTATFHGLSADSIADASCVDEGFRSLSLAINNLWLLCTGSNSNHNPNHKS